MRTLTAYEGQVEGPYKEDVALYVLGLIKDSMNRIDDAMVDSEALDDLSAVSVLRRQLERAKRVYELVETNTQLGKEQAVWLADLIAEKVDERCEELFICHGIKQLQKLDLMSYQLHAYHMFCRPGSYSYKDEI